ncbi:MAG: TVP38/TMEM64 family protein [Elusimicrobia bacterium]|nr:TVP38/TMEM64 family protein [Elusimicrobiota bacterium]
MRSLFSFRSLLSITLISSIALVGLSLPLRPWTLRILEQIQTLGTWGVVALSAFYIPACILFLPGSLITLGAGFLFGVARGTLAVSVGSTLGAAAAFLMGRTLARNWVADKIANNPKFRAMDAAIGEQGFKIVLLTRLSPLFPFNLLNYALGLTPVSFRDYFFASWIGMLPGTLLYVYLGSAVKNLAALAAGSPQGGSGEKLFFGMGLVATVLVTWLLTRIARKALETAVPATQQ